MEESDIKLEENIEGKLEENYEIPQCLRQELMNGILNDMKSQFNSSDNRQKLTDNRKAEENVLTEAEENDLTFNKRNGKQTGDNVTAVFDRETPSCSKDGDGIDRSSPLRVTRNTVKEPVMSNSNSLPVLKSSNRRRSSREFSESVVQNAIARKEQSFHQHVVKQNKRSSRPLKPTQKILDNMAAASRKRVAKFKVKCPEERDSDKKAAKRTRNSPRNGKRIKHEESDGSFNSDEESFVNPSKSSERNDVEIVYTRRSKRISSAATKKDEESPKNSQEKINIASDKLPSAHLSALEELILSRVCLCTKKTDVFIRRGEDIVYCEALDSIDGKVIGCCRTLNSTKVSAVRPSLRIPYALYCKMHRDRLRTHNCCPTCGIFCTQGTFSECDSNHQYHTECHMQIGEKVCCPHCGLTIPTKNVKLILECDQNVMNNENYITKHRLQFSSANLNDKQTPTNQSALNPIHMTYNNTATNNSENSTKTSENDVKTSITINVTPTVNNSVKVRSKFYKLMSKMFRKSVKSHDSNVTMTSVTNPKKKLAIRYKNPLEVSCVTNLIPIQNLEQQNNDEQFDNIQDDSFDLYAISKSILEEKYGQLQRLLDAATVSGTPQIDLSLPFAYPSHRSPPPNTTATSPTECTIMGTILHYGCALGRTHAVHLLVNQLSRDDSSSDDVKQLLQLMDSDQNTPLAVAMANSSNECARVLLDSGLCSIMVRGADGMSPLHTAARSGNVAGCQLLLNHPSLVHAHAARSYLNAPDDGGWTAMIWASEHAHVDVVALLLAHGADRTRRDVEHNMAVHWACYAGHGAVLNVLLAGDEQYPPEGGWRFEMVNAANIQGDTPLHLAAHQGHTACITQLLAHGAEPDLYNKMRETPLDLLADTESEAYRTLAQYSHQYATLVQGDSREQLVAWGREKNGVAKWCRKQILLNNDISRGRESNPIQLLNGVDATGEPRDYRYVTACCLTTENVRIDARITSLHHCDCSSDDIISCLTYMPEYSRNGTTRCQCVNEMRVWYCVDGRLVKGFNFQDPPTIFECNDRCNCNSLTCGNRVVQKNGSLMNDAIRTQVFRTRNRGWALRTLRNILQGSYVCEYVGEVLNDRDVNLRPDDSYVFDLDSTDNELYCIDAKFYGNMSRFINHSCQPNLVPVKVFTNHQDSRFPRIAFFANRNIRANDELSFDYGEKFWIIKCKTFTCECGTSECKYSKDTISATLAQCCKTAPTTMATCNGH